jgi:hypothetical protein
MMTDAEVAELPQGTHNVAQGLYMRVRGGRQWLERHKVSGKDVWTSLGYVPDVTVAEAVAKVAAIRSGRIKTEVRTVETEPLLWTLTEVSTLARLSLRVVHEQIDRGHLSAVVIGTEHRVLPAEARRWIDGLPKTSRALCRMSGCDVIGQYTPGNCAWVITLASRSPILGET